MISKACIVGAYQKKLEELARFDDVELTVIVPPYWRDERGMMPLERLYTEGYQFIVEPMWLNGHFHLHFYPGLGKHVRRLQPDIVHIDEEPYNLATFQAMRLAKRTGAKALFFTWQNLKRTYPLPFSLIEGYNLKKADYAIAGNQEAVEVWRGKGYKGPIKVIPQFGVDPEIYAPRSTDYASRFTLHPSRFTIGYVVAFSVKFCYIKQCSIQTTWTLSSAGRASALQAEGRRFDPVILHHLYIVYAGLAQLVEQLTCNQ